MAASRGFMENPLVIWAQTFTDEPVTYKELCEGFYLNAVMQQIDPRSESLNGMSEETKDLKERLQVWDNLMRNIKTYYKEVLQQFVVMKLPSTMTVCQDPDSDDAKREIQKVLLLLLGCAVQCEKRELFITNITKLELDVQQHIKELIEEITDDTKNVFSIHLPEEHMDEISHSLHAHLTAVVQERDGYIEEIKELSQTVQELEDLYQAQRAEAQKAAPSAAASGTSPEKQEKNHIALELAECKAKMRKLRQELEDKTEQASEFQDDLEEHRQMLQKLRSENLELTQDARAARSYRDEVDILKEKANRVDRCETEITKYKERLNELEYFKSRVEELRQDNEVLGENKMMLEEQVRNANKRVETVIELENELRRYKEQIEQTSMERDHDRVKIQEYAELNAKLEFEKKNSFHESATLEDQLNQARSQLQTGLANSLSDQLNETSNAKFLRLEFENQRLQKCLEESKQSSLIENTARVVELEKENNRLAKKVETLQDLSSKETQILIDVEQKQDEMVHEKDQLCKTIETIKESSERQVKELEREKESLTQTISTLRERNEKTQDIRMKEVEKENVIMHEQVTEMKTQLSNVEYKHKQLQKAYGSLQDNIEQIQQTEKENEHLEKQNNEMRKSIATLRLTCDKYEKLEQDASYMEVENQKLTKMVTTLQENLKNKEALEQENINLTVETQRLQRSVETVRNSSSKVVDLEHENNQLQRQIQTLQRTLESNRSEKSKQEQLEIDLLELDTENQKLQRSLEGTNRRLDELQRENTELDMLNEKLHKTIESMRMTVRKLEELEKDNKDLEVENGQIGREKMTLEKENKKLKLSVTHKDTTIDELSDKMSVMERERKHLNKLANREQESSQRVKNLEEHSQEILQQCHTDRKTLATLRESLVSEKIKTQQLNNELEKVSQELNKVGLTKEKLIAAEQAEDENKFKALESLMEDSLRKSMTIKEEKIQALESRLEESKNRNVQLQTELRNVKHQFEGFQQLKEEESIQQTPQGRQHTHSVTVPTTTNRYKTVIHKMMPNPTQEILELKDHMITVERKNATLEAENRNFHAQYTSMQARVQSVESQNSRVQTELSKTEGQFQALQSQVAKLQVENTTLQSQNASFLSQTATLQKQLSQIEQDQDQLVNRYEELQSDHESLITDHEALQRLHEELSKEYEALISQHGSLKANHKSCTAELKILRDEQGDLMGEKEIITQLKHSIERDRQRMKNDSHSLSYLQTDNLQLKEENLRLKGSNDKMTKEIQDMAMENKTMKNDHNTLKMRHGELQRNYTDCKDRLHNYDVEISKIVQKCEALDQLNSKLEDENRNLMIQLQALMTQNQDMLTQTLENKDHFHEEEKNLLDKLSDLRRQKEKLEDKIMDQYKRYDPNKKKSKGFGATLVRRAKAMMKGQKGKSKSSLDLTLHDSPENSSMGSGSFADMTDSPKDPKKDKKMKGRSGSIGNVLDSPKLSKQNKKFAKSTTALNMLQSSSGEFALRGAKSTENISPQNMSNHHHSDSRDGDSMSSSNSSHPQTEWPLRSGGRRRLLDSSSSSAMLTGNHSRESSFDRVRHLSMQEDDEEDEDDGMISLEQFLQESDKSPKTRRKLWKKDNRKTTDAEMDIMPASELKNMDPKSPTLEPDDSIIARPSSPTKDKNRPKTPLMMRSSGQDHDMSRQSSGSSLQSYASQGILNGPSGPSTPRSGMSQSMSERNLTTSTPKASNTSSAQARLFTDRGPFDRPVSAMAGPSQPPGQHDRLPVREEYGSDLYGRNRPVSNPNFMNKNPSENISNGNSYYHVRDNKDQNIRPYPQQNTSTIGLRDNTDQNKRSYSQQNIYGSIPPSTGQRPTNNNQPITNNVPRQSHDNQPIIGSAPRQGDLLHSRSKTLPRNHESPYMDMGSAQKSNFNQVDDTAPRYPPRQYERSNSVENYLDYKSPQYDSPKPLNHQAEGDHENYSPGNFRNLMQTFQKNVNQPPVPPPRKSRPVSAGPIRPTIGSGTSAFSVPQSRQDVPQTPQDGSARGRLLPQTPDDRQKPVEGRIATPPRPNGPQNNQENKPPNKSAVWFEYGCV